MQTNSYFTNRISFHNSDGKFSSHASCVNYQSCWRVCVRQQVMEAFCCISCSNGIYIHVITTQYMYVFCTNNYWSHITDNCSSNATSHWLEMLCYHVNVSLPGLLLHYRYFNLTLHRTTCCNNQPVTDQRTSKQVILITMMPRNQ